MKKALYIILLFIGVNSFAQKKILDHKDFDIWNTIKNQDISVDGKYIIYSLEKGEKDNHLKIKDANASLIFDHERSENGRFTYNSSHVLFTIKAWKDSVTEMNRRKVKKNNMPKDTLGIFNLKTKSLTKIPNVKSYKTPNKWSGMVAYLLTEVAQVKSKDTSSSKKKAKKVSTKNGYHLVVRDLVTGSEDTIKYVTNYSFAKEAKRLVYTSTGENTKSNIGVFVKNFENGIITNVFEASNKSKFYKLQVSDSGKNLGFVVDTDTTKALVRPNKLYHWSEGQTEASMIVDSESAPKGYRVSSDGPVSFSKDDSKMYFGLATPPIVKDTTLLKEEIVDVEVWTYNEPRLYTVQEIQMKNDQKKSYQTVVHLKNKKLVQIATTEFPNASIADKGNGNFALVSNNEPYQLEAQWTGQFSTNDLAIVNVNDGTLQMAIKRNPNDARFSPKGEYAFGYNQIDSTWYTYSINTSKYTELTKGKVFYNELNDSPNYPGSYGSAGWTKNDESVLIYDRYDIWKFNPNNGSSTRLTKGREQKITYRYVRLDLDEDYIDDSGKWLLTTFNENNKHSGYYEYNASNGKGKQLLSGAYSYSRPRKAKNSDKVIFTRQSFQEFPNIRVSDLSFKKDKVISNANPQQSEYNWGTAEIVKWTSLDGMKLEGMLIKPEDFNPNKKYPMIVNFYEKSSNGVFRHKAPSAGRSTINYSFYTSRGYLIFNPDVYYREGYPGESAFNCVIPGITSLIEKGFVDKDNIGVQGHSWGGYQIAYLVTKTDIFKAAESGAPVVNMISAFGGIRWDSGLSRQFQYEHTQSRIGGTPWEYPQRYVENSPIFNMDKVNTPLLIMHNDKDGHVPWYQGIEYFTALRRLGKPSWLLNYNGARHWPLKIQNRKDFNIRMQQFFDHYLQSAHKPVWMERGVPAIEKGINQGLELLPNKN